MNEKNNTEDKEEQHASPKIPENVKPGKKHEPGKSKKKSGDSMEIKRQTTEQMKKKVETEAAINMSMDIISVASQFAIDMPTTAQNEREKEEKCLAYLGKITQPFLSLSCEHVDRNLNRQHKEFTL